MACNPAVARKQKDVCVSHDYTSKQPSIYCLDKHLQIFRPQEQSGQECRGREAKQKDASFFPPEKKGRLREWEGWLVVKDKGQSVCENSLSTTGLACPGELMSSALQRAFTQGLFRDCSLNAAGQLQRETEGTPSLSQEKATLNHIYR